MDINKKLEDALKGMAANPIQRQYLENYIKSSDGRKIKNSLSDAEKQKIINKFSQLDANQIKKALSKDGASKLAGMSSDDIIRMLKRL